LLNPRRLLVQLSFGVDGALLGQSTGLPLPLHHIDGAKDSFFEGRKIVCAHCQGYRL
jgi:hypothetical protein